MSTIKKTAYTIGGDLVEFSTPHIKREFWFAEDTRTIEEWDAVQEYVESCENENYFIAQNMKNTEAAHYLARLDDFRFGFYKCSNDWCPCWISYSYRDEMREDRSFVRELTEEEREQLREACEKEQAKFEKRLRTYLKRYGLTKCHFSTYWANR